MWCEPERRRQCEKEQRKTERNVQWTLYDPILVRTLPIIGLIFDTFFTLILIFIFSLKQKRKQHLPFSSEKSDCLLASSKAPTDWRWHCPSMDGVEVINISMKLTFQTRKVLFSLLFCRSHRPIGVLFPFLNVCPLLPFLLIVCVLAIRAGN